MPSYRAVGTWQRARWRRYGRAAMDSSTAAAKTAPRHQSRQAPQAGQHTPCGARCPRRCSATMSRRGYSPPHADRTEAGTAGPTTAHPVHRTRCPSRGGDWYGSPSRRQPSVHLPRAGHPARFQTAWKDSSANPDWGSPVHSPTLTRRCGRRTAFPPIAPVSDHAAYASAAIFRGIPWHTSCGDCSHYSIPTHRLSKVGRDTYRHVEKLYF